MSATAGLALPLAIGIGVKVPVLSPPFERVSSLNEKPSLQAAFNYAGSNAPASGDTTCVNAVGYQIGFTNTVYADILGLDKFELNNFTDAGGRACAPVGSNSGGSSSGGFSSTGFSSTGFTPAAGGSHRRDFKSSLRKRQNETTPAGVFDYVIAPETSETANDDQFQAINSTAFGLMDSLNVNTTTNGSTFADTDTSLTLINDLVGNDGLVADPDSGNLYYADANNGSLFANTSGIVEGGSIGRFFHYYTDTINAYGVSRLRLTDEEHIPVTADFVAFAPINYNADESSPDVYMAVDTVGNAFYPITCDFQGQPSKVFLGTDVDSAIQTLQGSDLRYTVTGGVVTGCYFLPWAAPAGSAAVALADDATASGTADATATSVPPAADAATTGAPTATDAAAADADAASTPAS